MDYNKRPLPRLREEILLRRAEDSISEEWLHISLLLRTCLNTLDPAPRQNPFSLPFKPQIEKWSTVLKPLFLLSSEDRVLAETVRQLHEILRYRNAIAHGAPFWTSRENPRSCMLHYVSGRNRDKPRGKDSHAPPFRLELLPGMFLEPEDAELFSFPLEEVLEAGRSMKPLRESVERLSTLGITRRNAPGK